MSFISIIVFVCIFASVAVAFQPAIKATKFGAASFIKMSDVPAPVPEAPAVPAVPAVPVFNPKLEAGVSGPFGFFDPLDISPITKRDFAKWRESEIKHGRVAMLAFLGVLAGEKAGIFFGDSITGPAILQYQQADAMFQAFTFNVLGFAAAVEGFNIVKGWESPEETAKSLDGLASLKEGYVAGDLKFDPLGLKPKSPADFKTMATKEINNGRLAMIAMAGIVVQELITGESIF